MNILNSPCYNLPFRHVSRSCDQGFDHSQCVWVRKFVSILFVVFGGIFLASSSVNAEVSLPLQQVKATVTEIIHIVQNDVLKGEDFKAKRKELICQAVERRFNFRLMTQLSLGQSWGKMSVEEQNRFVYLFTSLLENTYIRRVEGYSGEEIIYNKDIVKGDRALIYSVMGDNNGGLSLVYKLRNEGEQRWMIYDVLLEGASVIKQYRRQFAQVIEHENISGLQARLEEKVSDVPCEL